MEMKHTETILFTDHLVHFKMAKVMQSMAE